MSASIVLALALALGQAPTFRSWADAVTIDAAVTQRSRWVAGLSPEDFELTDNGVRQTILDLSVDAMPIDVTLLVEVSESTLSYSPAELTRGIREIAAVLTPEDRTRVVRFGSLVQRLGTPAELWAPLPPEGKRSALFDAVTIAAAQPRAPGFRRLVIIVTAGVDTISLLDVEARAKVLDRTDAAIFIVAVRSRPRPRPIAPRDEQTYDWILEDVVERTGGRFYSLRPGEPYGPALRAAIQEFRKRYVLRFIPTGVSQTGWHEVAVRVVKQGRYSVQARPGYFRDARK